MCLILPHSRTENEQKGKQRSAINNVFLPGSGDRLSPLRQQVTGAKLVPYAPECMERHSFLDISSRLRKEVLVHSPEIKLRNNAIWMAVSLACGREASDKYFGSSAKLLIRNQVQVQLYRKTIYRVSIFSFKMSLIWTFKYQDEYRQNKSYANISNPLKTNTLI